MERAAEYDILNYIGTLGLSAESTQKFCSILRRLKFISSRRNMGPGILPIPAVAICAASRPWCAAEESRVIVFVYSL